MTIRLRAPPGWEWEGAWQVDHSGNVDKDGWAYATDFGMMSYPPPRVRIITQTAADTAHTHGVAAPSDCKNIWAGFGIQGSHGLCAAEALGAEAALQCRRRFASHIAGHANRDVQRHAFHAIAASCF